MVATTGSLPSAGAFAAWRLQPPMVRSNSRQRTRRITSMPSSARDDYRQLFTAVFADFYLFDTFLGIESHKLDQDAARYLAELHLDRKVKIRNGALSTIALSQGQRKRLALLTAYLEDRPFYLFDEWASDQDPYFKNIFYTKLLPDLKARGKTVLVITHDDRYFDVADRIIKLDYGKIATAAPPGPVAGEGEFSAAAGDW